MKEAVYLEMCAADALGVNPHALRAAKEHHVPAEAQIKHRGLNAFTKKGAASLAAGILAAKKTREDCGESPEAVKDAEIQAVLQKTAELSARHLRDKKMADADISTVRIVRKPPNRKLLICQGPEGAKVHVEVKSSKTFRVNMEIPVKRSKNGKYRFAGKMPPRFGLARF